MSSQSTPPADAPVAPVTGTTLSDVTVHPLVLLSVVDHYNRVARGTRKRAIGVLLGSVGRGGRVDVTNSFAVPFEEDLRDPAIFYLDHNYLESMHGMFRKINAKERVVGFYSTAPKIRPNDLRIHAVMSRYCPAPCLVNIDVRPEIRTIPTTAYVAVEEVDAGGGTDGSRVRTTFRHLPSLIGAIEAEEVGVEHLLRDINDPTSVSTVASLVRAKMSSLGGLTDRLVEMKGYLESVHAGERRVNNAIVYNMQTIFNLLPNLNVDELVKGALVKTNDMHMVIYLSSLIRSVIALHDLVSNKITYMDKDDGDAEEKGKETEKKAEEKEKKLVHDDKKELAAKQ